MFVCYINYVNDNEMFNAAVSLVCLIYLIFNQLRKNQRDFNCRLKIEISR